MTPFRRHLRGWTLVWLMFQAASLSMLLPRDCCAAHSAHAGHSAHDGHGSAEAAPSEAEPACPMHRPAQTKETDCSLSGTCKGPAATLPMAWANTSLPPAPATIVDDRTRSTLLDSALEPPIAASVLPDIPPPRA
jgi:hypothetical protein